MSVFADMMIAKIESLSSSDKWSKPWICDGCLHPSRNLQGKVYSGINRLMLMMLCEQEGYQIPIFGTFNAFKMIDGCFVKKGECAFPVYYSLWSYVHRDTKEAITIEEYRELDEEDKANYQMRKKTLIYSVFNIDQTNYKDVKPIKYEEYRNRFINGGKTVDDGFSFAPLDNMISENSWLCPIEVKHQDKAYYSVSSDIVSVPLKSQFKNSEAFYGTLLHEMSHSTGSADRLDRLNREDSNRFGSTEYAREELIAELSAALVLSEYGMVKNLKTDSAAYLKSWLNSMKNDAEFIKTVLIDVRRATNMIKQEIER